MSVLGYDISSNNGRHIDFERAYAAGYRFVVIKVTEGTSYVNPYAEEHAREAKRAKLIPSAYAFVSPKTGRTGVEEANYFVHHARRVGLLEPGVLRPTADIEITSLAPGTPSRRYHYAFVEQLARRTRNLHLAAGSGESENSKPFIYTGSWFWDGVLGARNSHGCPLWLAAYSTAWRRFVPPAFKKGVSIHQETDKGSVPGAPGNTDVDRYLGKDTRMLRHHHVLHNTLKEHK